MIKRHLHRKIEGHDLANQSDNVVRLGEAAEEIKDDFLHWQCKLRQLAMREGGGRPTSAMRPEILAKMGQSLHPGIIVLIHKLEPDDAIAYFRHQVLKTQDPIERWEKATEHMSAGYFQRNREFSDILTALFAPGPGFPDTLLNHGRIILEFREVSRSFNLPCTVLELAEHGPLYQSTYWHNRLFNPNIPAGARITSFTPDWRHASTKIETDKE